jgi:hypothetical protein
MSMRYVALLVVFGLFLVACGDSGDAADPDRFCEILTEIDSLDFSGLAPDEVLEAVGDENAKFAEGLDVVPEEIKADAQLVADGVEASNELMLEAGGDFTQIDQAAMETLTSEVFNEEFDAAVQNVSAWRADSCT